MTARQKFWIKVMLAVTLPLWILPAALVFVIVMGFWIAVEEIWESVSALVDGRPLPTTTNKGPG